MATEEESVLKLRGAMKSVYVGTDALDVIEELKRLLRLARCPDPDCTGGGIPYVNIVPGYDGEPDIQQWEQRECQWCTETKAVLDVGR